MRRQKYHREGHLSQRTSAANVLAHKVLQKTTTNESCFEDEVVRKIKASAIIKLRTNPLSSAE